MSDRGSKKTGRPTLSRDVIVEAAVQLIDSQGVASLTMRSLGRALGVEAMAIYYYVNGRDDLLDAVVEHVVSKARVDPDGTVGPSDGWQGYLQVLAHSVRQLSVEHPHAFPLVATRHPAAPWMRPPLRSLDMVEDFLRAMLGRGLTEAQAVHVYRVFTSFLLGHLMLEASVEGAEMAPVEAPLDEGDPREQPDDQDRAALADYPTIRRLEGALCTHDTEAEFDAALEAVLDRLDIELLRYTSAPEAK
ncbi:MAG: TetR/AcrR family transcriptional regulator [Demequina sp.]